ncbi:hypothetical protein PENSPDRAFT_650543 [Peniophora sp. CONT]|nr:hypothetical protein PENSPDRAFT_650543 [Peniophora sp. CONT]
MWQPVHNGDVSRHVHDAKILEPVFFIRLDNVIGVDLAQVLRAPRPGTPLNIFYSEAPAPLGGLATTHLCIKWPGYAQEFRKQVEIKDHSRLPITRSKLVERIAKFVEKFIEEAASWPIDRDNAHWRVGPRYINKDHLYIVGLIHVSAGCWQPILQLKSLNWPLV